MSRRKKKEIIIENVKITGIADKGKAVGRDEDGVVYFVSDAVPGDVVNILRLKKRKGVYLGMVKDFVRYSPDRVKPVCEHFGVCGGCKWQHLDYAVQLQHKNQTVLDAMSRIAKIDTDCISPIKGADKIYQYRNKIEYSFSNKRWLTNEEIKSAGKIEQSPALGFHRAGAFEKVVDIMKCHLQDDLTNDIRNFIRDFADENRYTYYDTLNHHGFLRNIFLRNNVNDNWMITMVFGEKNLKEIHHLLDAVVDRFPRIEALYYIVNTKKNDSIFDQNPIHYHGEKYLKETLGAVNYKISPKSFFQTNTYQAVELFDIVEKYASLTGKENVYDLYTGIGSIALYLAKSVKQVVGIEEIEDAIKDAKINAELNNINNAVFYVGDVKNILTTEFAEKHGKPDVVITDPPRAGMHKDIIAMLLELESPSLVYVSCNPATQARDIVLLKEKYDVVKMQPVDMFPHTHHIENVALLKLKS